MSLIVTEVWPQPILSDTEYQSPLDSITACGENP